MAIPFGSTLFSLRNGYMRQPPVNYYILLSFTASRVTLLLWVASHIKSCINCERFNAHTQICTRERVQRTLTAQFVRTYVLTLPKYVGKIRVIESSSSCWCWMLNAQSKQRNMCKMFVRRFLLHTINLVFAGIFFLLFFIFDKWW